MATHTEEQLRRAGDIIAASVEAARSRVSAPESAVA
jgi:hypothetical protein